MDRIEVPCAVLHEGRLAGHIHQQQRTAGQWDPEAEADVAIGSFRIGPVCPFACTRPKNPNARARVDVPHLRNRHQHHTCRMPDPEGRRRPAS